MGFAATRHNVKAWGIALENGNFEHGSPERQRREGFSIEIGPIKPWVRAHLISLSECDSVPMGRQDVATGASPWTGMKNYGESRRDDMNLVAQTPVVPLGLKNAIGERPTGSRPWLQPFATPWRKHKLNSLGTTSTNAPFFQWKILHGVA